MYIPRELENNIISLFRKPQREGLLLPGIVGCGKTTLINQVIEQLKGEYECFSFTGDETSFRSAVVRSGEYILDFVRARTSRQALVFVDEVQKEESIFDAIKIAYDRGNISFIVSGSNPEFIKTKAINRLQRRATLLEMFPFTMPEILASREIISAQNRSQYQACFQELLFTRSSLPKETELPQMSVSQETSQLAHDYLLKGGLPLAWQSSTHADALEEVKKTFERGFDPILRDTNNVSSIVAETLAKSHSQEFTYQGVMQRARVSQRRLIVEAIHKLQGHGYLLAKEPWFPDIDHRSYITVYSYIDPGIVSYLTGQMMLEDEEKGPRIEGVCHSRLHHLVSLLPVKGHLYYFKPHHVQGKQVRYRAGEIDFLIRVGKRMVPIEVKASATVNRSDLGVLTKFIAEHKLPFGIVLYGGKIKIDPEQRLIFWPWFLV